MILKKKQQIYKLTLNVNCKTYQNRVLQVENRFKKKKLLQVKMFKTICTISLHNENNCLFVFVWLSNNPNFENKEKVYILFEKE